MLSTHYCFMRHRNNYCVSFTLYSLYTVATLQKIFCKSLASDSQGFAYCKLAESNSCACTCVHSWFNHTREPIYHMHTRIRRLGDCPTAASVGDRRTVASASTAAAAGDCRTAEISCMQLTAICTARPKLYVPLYRGYSLLTIILLQGQCKCTHRAGRGLVTAACWVLLHAWSCDLVVNHPYWEKGKTHAKVASSV